MEKFEKIALLVVLVIICICGFYMFYNMCEQNHKVYVIEEKNKELEQSIEKLQYAFENKSDTIVLTIDKIEIKK